METEAGGLRPRRVPAKPARQEDLVDLGKTFGVSFRGSGDDTDSSDAEFAPEGEKMDSEDSEEFTGEGMTGASLAASMEPVTQEEEESHKDGEDEEMEVGGGEGVVKEGEKGVASDTEYNPLIVRRSQRAIKPTKDIDLYLLGAKFGIDLEGSGADSSDQEFAPEANLGGGSGSSNSSEAAESESEDEEESTEPDKTGRGDAEVGVAVGVAIDEPVTKYEVLLCSVCLEDSGEDSDLVVCDRCGIAVHEGCYGVVEEEDVRDDRSDLSSFTTVPWFCDPCKAGLETILCNCELCPTIGGLFKQTIHGRWVHMVCALYTPSIEYVEPLKLCGVTLDQMPTMRWGSKMCQLCEESRLSKSGVCISCDAGLCKSSFHVTCAQRHGLLCEIEDDDDDKDEFCEPFFAHCKAHADKDLMKRKRRDYMSIIKRQRQVKNEEMEDRTQHYLEEAQAHYKEMFDKMYTYYQPEKGFRGEGRWLHHMPSALQRLTQKAQLLGHVAEVVVGETRWKVTPGLTVDFVKYFHERQKTMNSLEEQSGALQETYRQLREDQTRVKQEHSSIKDRLDSLKSEMKTTVELLIALDVHLTKLGLEQGCILPEDVIDHKGGEEDKGFMNGKDEDGVCAVCEKREEEHLMTVCDTCQLYYHIHCLDPPLSKVPKKTAKWGWQCHQCSHQSGDELTPIIPNFDEPSSRSGRRIKVPKALSYDNQARMPKKKKAKLTG